MNNDKRSATKAWLYVLLGLVVAAIVIAVIVRDTPGDGTGGIPELSEYFKGQMTTLGVKDIGQPIEGFDANLLITAFPGLEPADFEDVETREGHYEYEIEEDELMFVRDVDRPITSAERMVSDAGYDTLLGNVAERFGVSIQSEADVDELIVRINTGERMTARIDEGGSALGVRIVPLEVLLDSRCPVDVTCVQEGTLRLRAEIESASGTSEETFELNVPVTTEAEEITLIGAEPQAMSDEIIEPGSYVFRFEIQER